ncbi:DUF2804 domain-containing protein [Psychrobacter lutiphocae]|uniref:DUF2804 domain-containing protein n=1 Tax=Psychrobacter lutiphocae TaxID=540500 RepID=UPI00036E6684|nr:DUF2804 domain-containing protein [Psychrobacter lutiphocae]
MQGSTIQHKQSRSLADIEQLIVSGQPQFGVFSRVQRLNYLDYRSHLLSQKPVALWRKQLKINQFAFIQLQQPPYRICLALATIKLATTAFVYIYHQKTGEVERVDALQPLTRHSLFAGDHQQGRMQFEHSNLTMQLQFFPESLQLNLDCSLFTLSAEFQRSDQPLVVCSPSGRRGWHFTQKEPLQVSAGKLTFKAESKFFADKKADSALGNQLGNQLESLPNNQIELDQQALANLDWTLGVMRHETNWFWACINSQLPDGCHFMLNLAMGVNETGVSENACWIDGNIYYLPPVLFIKPEAVKSESSHFEPEQSESEQYESQQAAWIIKNQDLGWSRVTIDLTFTPLSVYKKSDNYGLIASVFEQWLGYYSGQIQIDSGADKGLGKDSGKQIVVLDSVLGLAEDHFAKW